MYDYMRALRKKFYTPPGSDALRRELDAAHAELHEQLNRDERKLLLRITDLQCAIQDEASLHSFLSGYKLASSIYCELSQEPQYSFDEDEEKAAEKLYCKELNQLGSSAEKDSSNNEPRIKEINPEVR